MKFAHPSYASSLFALGIALAACTMVILFSWPDPHDRKRAVAPKLVDCCDIKIANTTLFSRRSRAPEDMEGEGRVVPASLR